MENFDVGEYHPDSGRALELVNRLVNVFFQPDAYNCSLSKLGDKARRQLFEALIYGSLIVDCGRSAVSDISRAVFHGTESDVVGAIAPYLKPVEELSEDHVVQTIRAFIRLKARFT